MIKISIEVNKNCETLATELLKKIQRMDVGQLLIMNEYAQRLLDKPQEQVIYSMDKDGKIDNVRFIRKE